LPPVALADPVTFTVVEQKELIMTVAELAEDTDGLITDELSIVDYNFNGMMVILHGDCEVVPDGLNILFTSIDISAPLTINVVCE
jgi:hypothetical protein